MAIIGIDLGTTNSLVAVWKDNKSVLIPNGFDSILTPSVVSLMEDGSICVGEIAKQRLVSHPSVSVGSFKRFMGTEQTFKLGKKSFTAIELSSFVIKKLVEDAREYLGEEIEEAVISVPAYFGDAQRSATKLAGELAGIKVERIINEPSAAALSCGLSRNQAEMALVFDFGGGTLDISLVDMFENVVEIVCVSGDNQLGGNDFDEMMTRGFIDLSGLGKFYLKDSDKAAIKGRIEEAKHRLSHEKEVTVNYAYEGNNYSFTFNSEVIIEMCDSIFSRIKKTVDQVLLDSKLNSEDIDNVIMVGGSSNMRIVQLYLKHLLKKTPIVPFECDLAIARGCGMVAGIKQRDEDIKDVVLTDICPFSLGIGVHNKNDFSNPLFSTIITRNTVLPSSRTSSYVTANDNQTIVNVSIHQGESMYANGNNKVGEFSVEVPKNKAGKEVIDVTFTYDINGILVVDVLVLSTKKEYHEMFLSKNIGISEEKVKEITENLKKIKSEGARESEATKLILARVEKLFVEYPQHREQLMSYRDYYLRICDKGIKSQISKKTNEFSAFLDQLEESSWTEKEVDFEDFKRSLLEEDEDDFDPTKMN